MSNNSLKCRSHWLEALEHLLLLIKGLAWGRLQMEIQYLKKSSDWSGRNAKVIPEIKGSGSGVLV